MIMAAALALNASFVQAPRPIGKARRAARRVRAVVSYLLKSLVV